MTNKIKLINNYKLLARLHSLIVKKENVNLEKETGINPDNIDKIITNFKISYPNIDISDLKEVYEIPNGDSTYQQIREYNYSEYETEHHEGYKELLELSKLCSKYLGYSLFRTMLGEIYHCVDDFNNEYEVIYIQQRYGSEQLFVLLNKEHNKIITAKVSEWHCGKLNGESKLYSNRNKMLSVYETEALSKYKDVVERVDRLKKESK